VPLFNVISLSICIVVLKVTICSSDSRIASCNYVGREMLFISYVNHNEISILYILSDFMNNRSISLLLDLFFFLVLKKSKRERKRRMRKRDYFQKQKTETKEQREKKETVVEKTHTNADFELTSKFPAGQLPFQATSSDLPTLAKSPTSKVVQILTRSG
jgi:hypothetical protein